MKTKNNFKEGSRGMLSSYRQIVNGLVVTMIVGMAGSLSAQDQPVASSRPQAKPAAVIPDPPQFTKPTWYLGAALGANINFYRGTTQELNSDLTVPAAFRTGQGVGLYLAPLIEYHKPDSRLGVMLQAGYDGRSSSFQTVYSPCDCKEDLKTNLAYITVEPSLRFAPFKSSLYFFAGPRLAFNVAKSFKYSFTTDPYQIDQAVTQETKGDFSHVYPALVSMQVGAGFDIPLSNQDHETQSVLSPFISLHPYFNQSPRSIETWTVTTLRVGAALKFGKGKLITKPVATVADPLVSFSVYSPSNIPVERRVRETFPLRNYVFFNLGSTEIPDRYVLLTKSQVKDFKEDQLEVFAPKKLSGRSAREMVVYYNILNILGDRLGKNPTATVTLAGASMDGVSNGLAMAESVKKYLVDVFGIAPSRITTEGSVKPILPSEQPGGTKELELLREGDHRVTISSKSPELTMEFQSGPEAPLRPVEVVSVQTAPIDSYVTFYNEGATDAFTSWRLEIKDDKGVVQHFGPYSYQEKVSIPGKSILATRPNGDFKVKMVGQSKTGGANIEREVPVHMVLWTPPKDEEGVRYSVIFGFNESRLIATYDKYLKEVVIPKIPKDATVIIHGHTDVIGDEAGNQTLSMARSNDVKNILEQGLSKVARTDVKFEVYGFGEDEVAAPFDNNYPEERFYNRTVIIDIIPHK